MDRRTRTNLAIRHDTRLHYTLLRSKIQVAMMGDNSSGRNAIVMLQQSTEKLLAADGADIGNRINRRRVRRPGCRGRDRQVPKPLVWAILVVETNVRLADVVEMAQTEAQEVVHCFAF